ncbi:VOC family protein [Psychrobacter aquimaris]|uniref:VOC family protein n=1 Tax=Psychrobacter aquimaris TaxID=292733 RepID=UPI003FD030C1
MKFRYARHTNNLDTLIDFYQNIIGLEKLGGFKDHNGYDGVFLGFPNQDWHMEFTYSANKAHHHPDRDGLIVFYLDSEEEIQDIIGRAKQADILPVTSQNPYWNENGIELTDPDGFGVILTIKQVD